MKKIILILMFVLGMSADFFTTVYPMDNDYRAIIEEIDDDENVVEDSGDDGDESVSEDETAEVEPEPEQAPGQQAPVEYDVESYEQLKADEKNMRNKNLKGAPLQDVNLESVDFSGSDLTGAHFEGNSTLRLTKFKNANLTDTHFEQNEAGESCKLEKVNFTDANLTRTDFTQAKMIDCRFNRSKLDHTNFSSSFLYKVAFLNIKEASTTPSFEGSRIQDSRFRKVHLYGVSFRDATIICASHDGRDKMLFESCEFKRVDLEDATLTCVYFKDTNMSGVIIPEGIPLGVKLTSMRTVSNLPMMTMNITTQLLIFGPVLYSFKSMLDLTATGFEFWLAAKELQQRERLRDARDDACRSLHNLFSSEHCVLYRARGISEDFKEELELQGAEFFEDDSSGLQDSLGRQIAVAMASAGAQAFVHAAFAFAVGMI